MARVRSAAPRLVFLVMSAQQEARLVEQLADALAPHRVVVHHDFSRRADFRIDRPNVTLVQRPRVTGWGTWGFCEGVLHSIAHCLNEVPFDYLQLLSPTCLPVRPLSEFVEHVFADPADAHADVIDLARDGDARLTYAYRALADRGSLRSRALRRIRDWYFGPSPDCEHRASLQVLRTRRDPTAATSVVARAAVSSGTRLLTRWPGGEDRYPVGLGAAVGSTWFGAHRHVCAQMLDMARRQRVSAAFERMANADEHLFASLLLGANVRLGASNHFVTPFDRNGHPTTVGAAMLDEAVASGRFFARKFSVDPHDAVRLAVLRAVAPRGARVRPPVAVPA